MPMMDIFRGDRSAAPVTLRDEGQFLRWIERGDDRRARHAVMSDLLAGRHEQHVRDALRRRFTDVRQFNVVPINVVRKIATTLAATYTSPPDRSFDGWDDAAAAELYEAGEVDAALRRLNQAVKLHGYSQLRVGWSERRGVPRLRVVTPDRYETVSPDPEWPDRVVVIRDDGAGTAGTAGTAYGDRRQFSEWTPDAWRLRNWRGQVVEETPNPYGGRLPFIPVFDEPPDDPHPVVNQDLVDLQIAVDVLASTTERSAALQSFGQLWATGLTPDSDLSAGPDKAVALPSGEKMGFAHPDAPLGELLRTMSHLVKAAGLTRHLNPVLFEVDQRYESGAAKLVQRFDLVEQRRYDQQRYRRLEDELLDLMKTVARAHGSDAVPADAQLTSVNFQEPDVSPSMAERLANADALIRLGAWSPADLILSLGEADTREQAVALAQRRRLETAVTEGT